MISRQPHLAGLIYVSLSATILLVGLLVVDFIPMGIPGEWVWPRIPFSEAHIASMFLAGIVAGLILVYLWFGSSRFMSNNSRDQYKWLAGLTCMGIVAPLWLCQAAPMTFGLQRAPLILYYPMTSGYFLEAKRHPESLNEYLQKYPQELKQGDYLHLGTHPPGLILLYRLLDQSCQQSPLLCKILKATEPFEITQAFDFLSEQTAQTVVSHGSSSTQNPLPPLLERDRRIIWLRIMLGSILISSIIPAVYYILKRETTPHLAWWFAGCSIFIPGVISFFPKSDTLYPACSILIVLFTYLGLTSKPFRMLQKYACFCFAGILLILSLSFSLALLPIGLVIVIWLMTKPLFDWCMFPRQSLNAWWNYAKIILFQHLLPFGVGAATTLIGIWLFFQVNMLEIWQLNLHNHARFYHHNDRHYWLWLAWNLMELLLTLGIPLAVPMLIFLVNFGRVICIGCFSLRWDQLSLQQNSPLGNPAKGQEQKISSPDDSILISFCFSTLLIWVILWLSGKNMGEAMRLWIFWTPLFILISGFITHLLTNNQPEVKQLTLLRLIVFCQIIVCLTTASRIDGFGFTTFYK